MEPWWQQGDRKAVNIQDNILKLKRVQPKKDCRDGHSAPGKIQTWKGNMWKVEAKTITPGRNIEKLSAQGWGEES